MSKGSSFDMPKPNNTARALYLACRRLVMVCPYDTCPIMRRACMSTVPLRRDCAERMRKYLLRRSKL